MEIKLNEIGEVLDELEYPVSQEEVIDDFGDVTLLLADGEAELSGIVSAMDETEFGSATELEESLYANLPTEAVGEPGQSEGDS